MQLASGSRQPSSTCTPRRASMHRTRPARCLLFIPSRTIRSDGCDRRSSTCDVRSRIPPGTAPSIALCLPSHILHDSIPGSTKETCVLRDQKKDAQQAHRDTAQTQIGLSLWVPGPEHSHQGFQTAAHYKTRLMAVMGTHLMHNKGNTSSSAYSICTRHTSGR